jgi:hypothetical protein
MHIKRVWTAWLLLFTVAWGLHIGVSDYQVVREGSRTMAKGKIFVSELLENEQLSMGDDVVIVMDVLLKKGVKWPPLPDSYTYWTEPPYHLGNKNLDEKTIKPKGIRTVTLWSWSLDNSWQKCTYEKNGEMRIDFSKCKRKDEKNFTFLIPNGYEGKRVRIRAVLTHRIGGPNAMWYPIRYAHTIIYEGKWTAKSLSSFESEKNMHEALKRCYAYVKEIRRHIKVLKKRKEKADAAAMSIYSGQPIGGYNEMIQDVETQRRLHSSGANWKLVQEALDPSAESRRLKKWIELERIELEKKINECRKLERKSGGS